LFGGSIAQISEQLQELIRSGEISQDEADAFLLALSDRIRQPVDDAVTSQFGQRRDPFTGQPGSFHEGVDFGSEVNTAVRSVADGIVEVRYTSATFGLTIIVNHGTDASANTYYTLHAHNDSFVSNLNDIVGAGDTLARSGNTGRSTNPHVHFEVRVVPPGVLGPVPDGTGAPTNPAFFDQELAVDPLDLVWPDLTLQCAPGC
jgi:murein DD-endopeptidase MepM/ murein hydrolase activator NlpD